MKKLTFLDYWETAKSLKPEDRANFFSTFSKYDQTQIKKSYHDGGWSVVFLRNELDYLCDLVKSCYDIDLYNIRARLAMKHERLLVSKDVWDEILELFSDYENCVDMRAIFGGVHSTAHVQNQSMYELFYKDETK